MRHLLLYISLVLFTLPIRAQQPAGPEALSKKAEKFGNVLVQEKVFVHLDNTCYFVGDTIRYKAYVVRADKGTPTDLSRIVYAELYTPDGYLVERQQLQMENGSAHGALVLTDSLYAGYYELRAYTRWMLNFGVTVHDHLPWSEDRFFNKAMAKQFFTDYDKLYSRVFAVYDKPAQPGTFTKEMTVRPLRRYFKTAKGKPQLDVKFYPEGGTMVAGTTARVAFEANTAEGKHLEGITLSITNRQGKEVAQAAITNRGRGMFYLPDVQTGESYTAHLQYRGYDYSINLPKAEEQGYALRVTTMGNEARAVVTRPPGMTAVPLGLQTMHGGKSTGFHEVTFTQGDSCVISLTDLPTGVNQLTLFDGDGRIYADRLCFAMGNVPPAAPLRISGIKDSYEPYAPITLQLQLPDGCHGTDMSLSVRDHATDEGTFDSGNILTEFLLCSELKGFVEAPEYYFEANDDAHRQALDLLMMIQGWRRYSWQQMAGIETFTLTHMPEQLQTLSGTVNPAKDYRTNYDATTAVESNWNPGGGSISVSEAQDERDATIQEMMDEGEEEQSTTQAASEGTSTETTRRSPYFNINEMSSLKEEVNVWPTYVQGIHTLDLQQTTEKGRFYMKTPLLYEDYILFLSATDADKGEEYVREHQKKGFTDETAYPDYYVKLDLFYPRYTTPYSFYQDSPRYDIDGASPEEETNGEESFTDRSLSTVTVQAKRGKGGLRKLDLSKPALVIDAYEAFNATVDCGLNPGTHNWITFPSEVAMAYIGDMGMDREYFLQIRYDGKPINLKSSQSRVQVGTMANGVTIEEPSVTSWGRGKLEAYHKLSNLDKLYIYTDYAPREQGSSHYDGSNQPDVVIDYRRFEGEGYQKTYRDRHLILRGYSVCDDFYSPDYSTQQLPDTPDYRRTLYWVPRVPFDKNGQAELMFYNNSTPSTLAVSAEGITQEGVAVTTP